MKRLPVVTSIFVVLFLLATSAFANSASKVTVQKNYGSIPLSFEMNEGQVDDQVKFLSRGQGYNLFLTPTESVISLSRPINNEVFGPVQPESIHKDTQPTEFETATVRMKLVDANSSPKVEGIDQTVTKSNYLIGNDPDKWRTNVSNYSKVKYEGVYSGIDLVYYGNQRKLEYDFIVKPGADYKTILMSFEGADKLSLDDKGDLILATKTGEVTQHAPIIYQVVDGKRQPVSGNYVLQGEDKVGFQVAKYDAGKELVIDPVLEYSTYLGGASSDRGSGIAVDSAGNAYVAGSTRGAFPTINALDGTYNGIYDVFVSKINASGTALVYSTYLGGTGDDLGDGIAVDSAGNAFITGTTRSTDFPTVKAINASHSGAAHIPDAFVSKINASGTALVYSTYLGGTSYDYGVGIAADNDGNAYVTGWTQSANFPTFNPLDGVFSGSTEAFVSKINAIGELVYSTFLGGAKSDNGIGIAADNDGNAYVTGFTSSTDFPKVNAIYGTYKYNAAYVSKINASGTALVYSTYLGSSAGSSGRGIAVDSAGNAYVMGTTGWTGFPVLNAFDATHNGLQDVFVSKINASGTALVYSTYLGGSKHDYGEGIAVDSAGNAYVTGHTYSTNFPTESPIQASKSVYLDTFVTKLDSSGSSLTYSTYLGGIHHEQALGMAIDIAGNVYVTGWTRSTNFPTVNAIDGTLNGSNYDVFVTKISDVVPDTTPPTITAPADIVAYELTGPSTAIDIGQPTVSDDVSDVANIIVTNTAPATGYSLGTTTVTWTATDEAENSADATQSVEVVDTTPPSISAPADVTVEATGSTMQVDIGDADGNDLTGSVIISNNAPATFSLGTTTVIWTASDGSGNSATANQLVTVEDTTAPAITAPADVTVDATGPLTTVALADPTATDAVGVATLINDAPSEGFPVDSTTTVTWTATDEAGNSSSTTQTVTVKPFALSLNIEKAKVKLHRVHPDGKHSDKDKVEFKGHYEEFANGDGLDLSSAVVTLNGITISGIKFKKHGKFEVKGKHLNLKGIDFSQPVSVSIRIGNDLGEQSILFDSKGKFDDGDKDKDKDKDKKEK
jgi:hypothetical protein